MGTEEITVQQKAILAHNQSKVRGVVREIESVLQASISSYARPDVNLHGETALVQGGEGATSYAVLLLSAYTEIPQP